jgi:hypothetical protein
MSRSYQTAFAAPPDASPTTGLASAHRYFVYGMTLQSEISLALPERGYGGLGQIELRIAPAPYFSAAARSLARHPDSDSFYQSIPLRDGSTYVRWQGVGEFLISADGGRITGRQHRRAHTESFQVYLLGQALSYALVKRGFEPLHATAIVVNGAAAVLLGNSGFGKSSLGACFLEAGYQLLTDDLLVLRPCSGGFMAYPGPPRIKLFPRQARRFLQREAGGVAMNSGTEKLILPLDSTRSAPGPVPLRAIYTLLPPGSKVRGDAVRIAALPPRQSFLALVRNTFNYRVVTPARLERHFEEAARLAGTVSVRKVSYPRVLSRISKLRDALLADLDSIAARRAA